MTEQYETVFNLIEQHVSL